MARHAASSGPDVRPRATTPTRSAPAPTRSAGAPTRRGGSQARPAAAPSRRAGSHRARTPGAAGRAALEPAETEVLAPRRGRHGRHAGSVSAEVHRATAPPVKKARVPRVLLETLAWVAFAAVVAFGVIAAGEASLGRAFLWAAGLGGIVVVAIAVLALTGTRLEDLNRPVRDSERPD